MKSIKNFCCLLILMSVSACSPFNSLKIFILGRWSVTDEFIYLNQVRNIRYEFLFLPLNILLVDVKNQEEEIHNELYSYHFIEQDRIMVEGRFNNDAKITRDGGDLIITSNSAFPPDGRYTRVISIWDFLCAGLAIVLFLFPVILWLRARQKHQNI